MENICVQFGDMVYQQIVGIPMGTNCAPLIADLFLYLSKVLTEHFSILYKTQTNEDIRFYILTLVLVDINFTFSAKVWIQL